MTITDEEAAALAREEAAVKLARDTIALLRSVTALLGEIAAKVEAAAERADYALAGGTAPLPVAHDLITASRKIAAHARGKAVTP